MNNIEMLMIGDHQYSIGRLNAMDQLHVSRKIAPLVPTIIPIISEVAKGGLADAFKAIDGDKEIDLETFDLKSLDGLTGALEPLTTAFSAMPEKDVDYVVQKCLSVVNRGTARLCVNGQIMFDDLDMGQILPLTLAVIRVNLGNFIKGLLTKASATQEQSK